MPVSKCMLLFVTFLCVVSLMPQQSEAKTLAVRGKVRCVGTLRRVCNYIGSRCHAEVLSGRKRRSITDAQQEAYQSLLQHLVSPTAVTRKRNTKRRFKVKVTLSLRCNLCSHVCW